MSLATQIMTGSTLLLLCALVHVAAVALAIPFLENLGKRLHKRRAHVRGAILLTAAVLLILLAHTIQIWSWAFAFFGIGAFGDFASSFYFATATYTTLGYGDLTLGEGLRVFGTFAAITGLLTFGFSTAFLIGLISRMMPRSIAR